MYESHSLAPELIAALNKRVDYFISGWKSDDNPTTPDEYLAMAILLEGTSQELRRIAASMAYGTGKPPQN